jgi:hypothetical protein
MRAGGFGGKKERCQRGGYQLGERWKWSESEKKTRKRRGAEVSEVR